MRLAVAPAALGGICLVAAAVVANVLADHSSSDSSASSLTAVGLAGFGVSAVLGAAVAGGGIALAWLRRPDPAATARRNDLPGARRRHLGSRVAGLGILRLAVALAALGGVCLTGGVLAGVLGANLSSPASSLISLIAGVLVALGLLAAAERGRGRGPAAGHVPRLQHPAQATRKEPDASLTSMRN